MGSKERFSPDADGPADGARLGLTSVWEGSANPAPSGPYGHVHLPPVDSFDLQAAVEALVLVDELQSWAEAKLVGRIREHYRAEARSGHDDETVAEEESSSLAAEEIGAALRLPARTARTLLEQSRSLVHQYPRTFIGLESGKLSWRHATTIADECIGVPAHSLAVFEKDLIETAQQCTVAKLTRQAAGCGKSSTRKLHRHARAVPRPSAGWSLSRTRTGWRG